MRRARESTSVAWGRAAIVALVMALGSGAAAADERPGSLGFSISVDGDGFFLNPTLRSITVDGVVPASPAAAAGIVPKDRIVEVEGRQVAGAKASELKPYLQRSAGQVVHLRLRRTSGDEYAVALIAVARE